MSTALEALFRPFSLKTLYLPNRIVMAPMSRYRADGGIPGAANTAYYVRRAVGGVGLILSEGAVINRPASRNEPGIPFFHGQEALAGWKHVIDAVHDVGGRMGPQIWHTGSSRDAGGWEPPVPVESPSGLNAVGAQRGETMSEEDIADTISAYAKAAKDAKRLGFDIAEIHGAHGYLIDEFFWSETNKRVDRYGGTTISERSRFAAEVITAVRREVGQDFPIIMRLSQFKIQDYTARVVQTPGEMFDWLEPLVDAGVDILHCSQRRFWEAEFPEVDGKNGLNFAGWAKHLTGVPTISVGSVGLAGDFISSYIGEKSEESVELNQLVNRMERDEFDLIAIGRALLIDPLWVKKVQGGNMPSIKTFDQDSLAELI